MCRARARAHTPRRREMTALDGVLHCACAVSTMDTVERDSFRYKTAYSQLEEVVSRSRSNRRMPSLSRCHRFTSFHIQIERQPR